MVYRYKCGSVECEEEYTGESGGTFGEGFKSIQRPSHPPITNMTPQVIHQLWKISALWKGGTEPCQIN